LKLKENDFFGCFTTVPQGVIPAKAGIQRQYRQQILSMNIDVLSARLRGFRLSPE